jgi:hypothetical protein
MVKAHIRLWLIALFLMLVAIPFVMPPEFARARIMAEYDAAAAIFGQDKASELAESANGMYGAFMQGSGLGAAISSSYVTEKEAENLLIAKNVNQDMSVVSNKYLLTFSTQIYGVIFRSALMSHWLIYVGVFLLAAFVDGYSQRQIKKDLIQMHAPIKFAASSHFGVMLVFTPIAYLLLPINVTPWFMPFWAVAMAYPIASVVSNFARVR